jgi:hypothetical protein
MLHHSAFAGLRKVEALLRAIGGAYASVVYPVNNAALGHFTGLIFKIPLLAGITFADESFDSIEWDTVKILLRPPHLL